MKQSNANRKTNEQAREILANILLFEVSDPRLRLVTITGCEVSYDRSYCNVFYTSDPGTYEEAAAGFSAAWRVTPELRFLLDPSVDEAERIARALAHEASRIPVSSETECETADADDAAHADRAACSDAAGKPSGSKGVSCEEGSR